MKKILCPLVLAAISFVACQQTQAPQTSSPVQSEAVALQIAYVNTDTLLHSYEYAVAMSDMLTDKAERAHADLQEKANILQQDYASFQRKVRTNSFDSQESYNKQGAKLQKSEQDLQELNQKLTAEIMQEQNRLTVELHDTITNFLREYAVGRYTLILSNNMGDNVLYAAQGVDITDEVVAALNKRYEVAKSKKN